MSTKFEFPAKRVVNVQGNAGEWKPYNPNSLEKIYELFDGGQVEFEEVELVPIKVKQLEYTDDSGNSCNLGGPADIFYKPEELKLSSRTTRFEDHGDSVVQIDPGGQIIDTFFKGEMRTTRVEGKPMYPRVRNLGRRPNQLPK